MKYSALASLILASGIAFAEPQSISVDAVQQNIASEQNDIGTILDVRTPEEFAEGHVPGAINVPVGDLSDYLEDLKPLNDRGFVVYCRSGKRAGRAINMLESAGFTDVKHMEGDMSAWLNAEYPIAK